jgi:hypothetical protein
MKPLGAWSDSPIGDLRQTSVPNRLLSRRPLPFGKRLLPCPRQRLLKSAESELVARQRSNRPLPYPGKNLRFVRKLRRRRESNPR